MLEGEIHRALVVVAHPDDAEFGCAGTIARWCDTGCAASYVICTDGRNGTRDRGLSQAELVRARQQEQRDAAAVLGVSRVHFLPYPDGGLENTPALRGELVRLIRIERPEVILTGDSMRPYGPFVSHRDHRMAGQAALDAALPEAGFHLHYPELAAEGLEPHRVKEVLLFAAEQPEVWMDIANVFERKERALRCHVSQFENPDEMVGMLRGMAARVGEPQGLALAEAFRRLRLDWEMP